MNFVSCLKYHREYQCDCLSLSPFSLQEPRIFTSPLHLTNGPSKCRSLYDDRTEILSRARNGVPGPIGGTSVDKSTLLCGVERGVSSSAGDMLLSVDSLGGVGVGTEADEEEVSRGRRRSEAGRVLREPAVFGPAGAC